MMDKLKYCVYVQTAKTTDDRFPYLGLEDIESKTGRLIEKESYFKETDALSVCFRRGDVLFGKLRPYLAKAIVAPFDGRGTSELLVMRCREKIENRFLYYTVLSKCFIDLVDSSTYGAKMPRASWDFIGQVKIWSPLVPAQIIIADYLDAKTEKIHLQIVKVERMIALLKEKREALIIRTVTKGLDPTAPMKDSGAAWIGQVPDAWSIKKIKYSFRLIGSGITPKSGSEELYDNSGIPWLNTGDLTDGYIKDVSTRISHVAIKKYPTLRIYPINSLVIAMYGATIGKLGITEFKLTTNQACCVMAYPKDTITKFAFYCALGFREHILSLAYGGGQPNISQNTVREQKIPRPPLSTQTAIVDYLDAETAKIDAVIAKNELMIEKLREYQEALITAAVTGQLDVGGEAE